MPARVDPIETQAHWDALAAAYDDAKARNDVYYRTLKTLAERWIGSTGAPAQRVLDVGCGTGQVLAHLIAGGAAIGGVGIDASPKMIEAASRCHAARADLSFRVMDAAAIAGLGRFDAILCADLLEHLADWRAVIRSIASVCRPGGTIVIMTPNPCWALPLWILETLRLKMPEGPHAFVPARAIAAELASAGARVVHASTALLVPARLLGLGPVVSRAAASIPVLRDLGVIQVVVARREDAP